MISGWKLQGPHDASDDTEEGTSHAKPRSLKRKRGHAGLPPCETELSAPLIELSRENPMTRNCRRQKKPMFPPTRDAETITQATGITLEYADTPKFDNCLLGYVMRSSSPEAQAIAAKVEPRSVHATSSHT